MKDLNRHALKEKNQMRGVLCPMSFRNVKRKNETPFTAIRC